MNILQDWVTELPLRHQGTLLVALRGCDARPKEDISKLAIRAIRGYVLLPADVRELGLSGGFLCTDLANNRNGLSALLRAGLDDYPVHFVTHLAHAAAVVGYYHPKAEVRDMWQQFYRQICLALHMNPESEIQLRTRLLADRV